MNRLDKAIATAGLLGGLIGLIAVLDVYHTIRTWHPPACARIAAAIDIAGDCRR